MMRMRPTAILLPCFLSLLGPSGAIADDLAVEHVGHFDPYYEYTDIWGFSKDGIELAFVIVGKVSPSNQSRATSIVNVTDPAHPVEIMRLDVPSLAIKTFGDRAYIVADLPGDYLTIVNLENPLAPFVETDGSFPLEAHNLWIDEERELLFTVNRDVGRPKIFSLSNPVSPDSIGYPAGHNPHDVHVRNDRIYMFSTVREFVRILSTSNFANPPTVGTIGYLGARTHGGWPTADGNYLLVGDEIYGGHLRVFDVRNPADMRHVAAYRNPEDPTSTIHNVVMVGPYAFCSWYGRGLQVFDLTVPEFPDRVGYDDSYSEFPPPNAFGIYPLAESGRIYLSDIDTGLHIFEFAPSHGVVRGTVRDGQTGFPISGAKVSLRDGEGRTVRTLDSGFFRFAAQPGSYTVVAEGFGLEAESTLVVVQTAGNVDWSPTLDRLPGGLVQGTLVQHGAMTPIPGATIDVREPDSGEVVLSTVTGANGAFTLSYVPAGEWEVSYGKHGFGFGAQSVYVPEDGGIDLSNALWPSLWADNFETNRGWAVTTTATTGAWERVDPNGTGGGDVQPADDHSPAGTLAFVTANGPASRIDQWGFDVDEGATTLTSPRIDLFSSTDPVLSYWRWFAKDVYSPPSEGLFTASLSSNDGASWVVAETLDAMENEWTRGVIRIRDHVSATNSMRIRFTATDPGVLVRHVPEFNGETIIEAAVDDVEIFDTPVLTELPEPRASFVNRLVSVANPILGLGLARFEVTTSGPIRLVVIDIAGRRVRVLADGGYPPGVHDVVWDGNDDRGRAVGAGVYHYVLQAAGWEASQRVVVLR